MIEGWRRESLDRGGGRRLMVDNRRDQARLSLSLERPLPREHLVKHCAERMNIGPRIRLFAL
jgi:hypothetical protein